MINQTSMAADATKLKQALQRLKGFVSSQHAELTEQQRATLNTMAAKQRNRGPAVWTAEVDELFSAVTGDVTRVATERSEARRASAESFRAAQAEADAAAEPSAEA